MPGFFFNRVTALIIAASIRREGGTDLNGSVNKDDYCV